MLTTGLFGRIAVAGGFSAVAALVLLATDPQGPAHGQWLAYTALACAQAVRAYGNRSLTEPLHRLSWNGVLLAAAVLTVVVQVAMPYVPVLADAFRAQPLSALEWALVAVVALGPALVAQLLRARGRGVSVG